MNERDGFVYATGRSQAAHIGLPEAEWDDCAAGFRLWMLAKYPDRDKLTQVCEQAPALVTRCARQYALDYQRRLYRRHEWLWSQFARQDGEGDGYDACDPDDALDAALCSIAHQQRFAGAFLTLSPANRTYLLRHFCDQESYAEIAGGSGKSINAIEQSVSRALKQLRVYFQKQSLETDDYADICCPPPPLHTS